MGERNVKHHGRNDAGNGSHRACTNRDSSPQGLSIERPTIKERTGLLLEIETRAVLIP
jgi:hypothetical protein